MILYKVKNKPVQNKKKQDVGLIYFIIPVIFLIVFGVYFIINNNRKNYNNIKINKKNYLVYTKIRETYGDYHVEIPYVNVRSQIVDQVNKEIDEFVLKALNTKKANITYEYDVNGVILSVVVKVIDYSYPAPDVYFRSYNIHLKRLELISDSALLQFFNVNSDQIKGVVHNKFLEHYNNVVKEGYFSKEECDYNCFLSYRGFDDYSSDLEFFVRDSSLIAFKPFLFYSIFGEEEYFKDTDFEFLITTTR